MVGTGEWKGNVCFCGETEGKMPPVNGSITVKAILKELNREGVVWIDLAPNRDTWQGFVTMLILSF
jgi:hypothetical protein